MRRQHVKPADNVYQEAVLGTGGLYKHGLANFIWMNKGNKNHWMATCKKDHKTYIYTYSKYSNQPVLISELNIGHFTFFSIPSDLQTVYGADSDQIVTYTN